MVLASGPAVGGSDGKPRFSNQEISMLFKKIILGICFFLGLSYFYPPLASFADTVILKSGQVIEGKIIENTGKYVKINFDGVDLIYSYEEVASVNPSGVNNAPSKELSSLYEAFNSSKNVVANKDQPAEPAVSVALAQPAVNADSVSVPGMPGSVSASTTVQEVISKLPKEYQEMFKKNLEMQGSGSTNQVSGGIPATLSNLPPEYQSIIKSSLEKIQADKQTTKFFLPLEKQQ